MILTANNRKTIPVKGINLSYKVHRPDAEKTIFFIHGNSISANSWDKQLNSDLLTDYRLVALDLPAHGDSEASPNPEEDYTLPGLAGYVVEFVRELANGKPYLLVGLSLGSNVLAESLGLGLKPQGIVLAGPSIVGKDISIDRVAMPGTHVFVVFTELPSKEEVRMYAREGSLSQDPADEEAFMYDYFRVKPQLRATVGASITSQTYGDEIGFIKNANMDTLVIMGKDEKVVYPDYLDDAGIALWQNKVHKISGASHLVNIDQPIAFNLLLAQYAAERFQI